MTQPESSRVRWRWFVAYAAMLAAAAGLFALLRGLGADLVATQPPGSAPGGPREGPGSLARVLLSLALITLATRLFGAGFRRFLGQPPVMGEIVAGLLLGPSVLGALLPAAQSILLPPDVAPYLGMISKVGVVLFLFLVGLDLDPRLLRGHTHATVVISHASILAPFVLGAALALALYPRYATSDVDFTTFSLYLGIALSVTAFPVLARILADRGAQHTPLGTTALACAAVDDVTAWTLLALLAGLAQDELGQALRTLLWLALYVGAMLAFVRPLLARFAAHVERTGGPRSSTALALVVVALLLSAVATEAIGVHALFGAFLLGALMPHEGRLARAVKERVEDFVLVLLLPSFFAFTGMRTQIGLLAGAADWIACAAIVLVATLGKLGGTAAAGRLAGFAWRPALALGVLMNTRGLMQLIVLDLGLELGVITPEVFTMMVVMALATTFLAVPALDRVLGPQGFDLPLARRPAGPA